MTVILGAGLAGLSTSFHLNHNCKIFEKKSHSGGHIHSQKINGFTWDEGPHVSFTKHDYVKDLFAESCEIVEFPVYPTNYYKGHWIPHPAQANLYALPEPIRTECLESFLSSRNETDVQKQPSDYKQWLHMAFGSVFAEEFPSVYTNKYWTIGPEHLTTDWVGERVFYPQVNDVKEGYLAAPKSSKHYQSSVRYPVYGGYYSFANKLKEKANIEFNKDVVEIDLKKRLIKFSDGSVENYTRLVNTIALPEFIFKTNPPPEVKAAASELSCSEVLLINIVVNHKTPRVNQWIYVYDKEKYSTRINFTELLSPNNGLPGKCGIQVEVYFSKYRQQTESLSTIIDAVCEELVEMKLINERADIEEINTNKIKYANVIFDHSRKNALEKILNYLEQFGLKREAQDLAPMTDWNLKNENPEKLGELILAGRFGEWKYYWTDDCVMRGLFISKNLNSLS